MDRNSVYLFLETMAIVVYIIILTFYGKKFNFSIKKSLMYALTISAFNLLLILMIPTITNGFVYTGQKHAVRSFFLIPITTLLVSKIFKEDYRKLLDFQAVPMMIWYGVSRFSCVYCGCCGTFLYHEGSMIGEIAHTLTGTYYLPNQVFEMISAWIIAIFIIWCDKKKKFTNYGYPMSLVMIIYGVQRFFWEFLRGNEKIYIIARMPSSYGYLGISTLALYALAMTVSGLILFYVLKNQDKNMDIK